MHDLPLVTLIAAAFTSAWLLGLLTQWLRLSPIVGYLLAGVVIGPFSPGFVGDIKLAHQLAEVGVILLMFGVGLHFHVKDLLAVKGVAIPGAVGQSLVATLMAVAIFMAFDFSVKEGAVIGMAMAVASTVVLMRVLMDADALGSPQGHVAVGWLLVEDVFTVIVLVLIPVMGNPQDAEPQNTGFLFALVMALFKIGVLVAVVAVFGSRVIPWVLVKVARLRSRELFTLTVLVFAIAIAAGSYMFFGASMALGAFLAGMMVAQSPVSHQAAADALPMRDAFAVLFFVSVGMIFDPTFLLREPLMVLAALGVIMIAKPLAAVVIVWFLGHSPRTALTVAVGLAQIGEFSFILADVARLNGLMPVEGSNVLVAAAILSITANPILFRFLGPMETWLSRKPRIWALLNARVSQRAQEINIAAAKSIAEVDNVRRAVVVGYGPVGRAVNELLRDAGLKTVVIDMNIDTVAEMNREGQTAIFGDASHESVLEQAGLAQSSHLVLTLPHSTARAAVVLVARNLSTRIRILVRAHYLREREDLEQAGATAAVFEEAEAAIALARLVLTDTGVSRDIVERKVRDLRLKLILENVSNLNTQTVRTLMVPWTRVRRLSRSASLEEVRRQVAEHRFSRWPVVEPGTGKPLGYLLAKDLIQETSDSQWTNMLRPLRTIAPDDDIQSTLNRLQREGGSFCAVEEAGMPIGLLTIEDILEQVVGRIEDEYPRHRRFPLRSALVPNGILLDVRAETPEEVIEILAAAIPASLIPSHFDLAASAIERERDLPTDVGLGVAIPHARCPRLAHPLLVFGRLSQGVQFSAYSSEPVRLAFLLVTPHEQPNLQVVMLGQLAAVVGNSEVRSKLLSAATPEQVLDIISGADPAEGA